MSWPTRGGHTLLRTVAHGVRMPVPARPLGTGLSANPQSSDAQDSVESSHVGWHLPLGNIAVYIGVGMDIKFRVEILVKLRADLSEARHALAMNKDAIETLCASPALPLASCFLPCLWPCLETLCGTRP